MEKFVLNILFFILIAVFSFTNVNAYSDYTWSTLEQTKDVSSNLVNENIDDNSNNLNLDCGACILVEQHSGQILYAFNSHEKLRPASVTKIMSIYLIMEALANGKITYNTKIPCSENAESMGGSQIWLTTSENLTVDEMLKAICVVSANDCVTAMAEYLGGTEENFVNQMNEKAKELRYE